MKVGIGNDHHGILLKNKLIPYLKEKGIDVINYGTDTSESVDYTNYAFQVGEAIRDNQIDFGILICGSGIGMSIACNKVKNVRCAKVDNVNEASVTRNDNDSNVIALSGNLKKGDAIEIIDTFLSTPFSNDERHIRRVEAIKNYDN